MRLLAIAAFVPLLVYAQVVPSTCLKSGNSVTCTLDLPSGAVAPPVVVTPVYVPPVVVAPPSGCISTISAQRSFRYAENFVDLNGIEMGGNGAVAAIAVTVAANDSSSGKGYLPTIGMTNSPSTPYSNRTVSISRPVRL